jgi:hypothetical protein
MTTIDCPSRPLNKQSKAIENRYHENLVRGAYSSLSMPEVYLKQVPNIELREKPVSKRMQKLKKSGLIGCLNDSEVTSTNYKDLINLTITEKSSS